MILKLVLPATVHSRNSYGIVIPSTTTTNDDDDGDNDDDDDDDDIAVVTSAVVWNLDTIFIHILVTYMHNYHVLLT